MSHHNCKERRCFSTQPRRAECDGDVAIIDGQMHLINGEIALRTDEDGCWVVWEDGRLGGDGGI